MRILRYVTLLLSLIAFAPLSYAIIEDWSRQPHDVPWWAYLILLSIALNFIYALLSGTPLPIGRLGRIVALWLDAKETELRDRAERP
jgi:hypothetical protein